MKKYTEVEVKEARAYLDARSMEPNWFKFTNKLMSNIKPFFKVVKNDKGVDVLHNPSVSGTLLFAFIDYFKTGEKIPEFVQSMLDFAPEGAVYRTFLENILEEGYQAIDESYVQYANMVKGGEIGGQRRWNKAQDSENDSVFSDDD